jgi:HD-like signal output (HDOD) protein
VALRKRLTEKVDDIAALPFVVRKLMTTLSDPNSTARELGNVIASDQALASKVLRLVNSAFYGFPNEITNIKYAVTVLGYNALRSLSFTIASHSAFFSNESSSELKRKDLWLHCLGTAIWARALARHFGIPTYEDFFAGGLIHDVGKVILDQYAPDMFKKVIKFSIKEQIPLYHAELALLGIAHPEIGQLAAGKWSFPPFLQAAIGFHHEPAHAGDAWEASAIIHMANYMCKREEIGFNGDFVPPVLDPSVEKTVVLDSRSLELIRTEVDRDLKNSKAFIEII